MSKIEMLKNELKRDIENQFHYVTREILLTLLATNKHMRYYDQKNRAQLNLLDRAIKLLWEECFDTEIEIFSNF